MRSLFTYLLFVLILLSLIFRCFVTSSCGVQHSEGVALQKIYNALNGLDKSSPGADVPILDLWVYKSWAYLFGFNAWSFRRLSLLFFIILAFLGVNLLSFIHAFLPEKNNGTRGVSIFLQPYFGIFLFLVFYCPILLRFSAEVQLFLFPAILNLSLFYLSLRLFHSPYDFRLYLACFLFSIFAVLSHIVCFIFIFSEVIVAILYFTQVFSFTARPGWATVVFFILLFLAIIAASIFDIYIYQSGLLVKILHLYVGGIFKCFLYGDLSYHFGYASISFSLFLVAASILACFSGSNILAFLGFINITAPLLYISISLLFSVDFDFFQFTPFIFVYLICAIYTTNTWTSCIMSCIQLSIALSFWLGFIKIFVISSLGCLGQPSYAPFLTDPEFQRPVDLVIFFSGAEYFRCHLVDFKCPTLLFRNEEVDLLHPNDINPLINSLGPSSDGREQVLVLGVGVIRDLRFLDRRNIRLLKVVEEQPGFFWDTPLCFYLFELHIRQHDGPD